MMQEIVRCFAEVVSPVAQGMLEMTMGQAVVGKLLDHFQSSQVLPGALEDSFEKAIGTIEVALCGPRFYHKTANKEFAERFRVEVLLPIFEEKGMEDREREEFERGCLRDLKNLAKSEVFRVKEGMMPLLAEEVGMYAVQEAKELEGRRVEARKSLLEIVRSMTLAPHALCQVLERENVIALAAQMHFGLSVQRDEVLFRAFYLVNQKGIQQQLSWIARQLESAKTTRDRESFQFWTKQRNLLAEVQAQVEFGLEHVKREVLSCFADYFERSESHFGLIASDLASLRELGRETIDKLIELEEKITSVGETADRVERKQDVVLQEVQSLREQLSLFMNTRQIERQSKLCDSLSIRTVAEKEKVKQFLERLRAIKQSGSREMMGLQIEVAALLGAAQETQEADRLLSEVERESSDAKEKGLAAYNRFVNFTTASRFEEAFEAYREAMEHDRGGSELFVTHKYRPVKILGAGGFGVVFLCEDEVFGPVVVKSLSRPEVGIDLGVLINEAKALARSRSPYIIGLKEYNYLDWGKKEKPYLVLEYFESEDLEKQIEKKGAFGLERGMEIAKAIAEGMREAHAVGVIHRDLKPANVLYREREGRFELKIIDFGLAVRGEGLKEIAKSVKSSGNRSVLDESFGGTLQYAPPEQMGEEVEGKLWPVGKYSDVYAYGRTLKKVFFGELMPHVRAMRSFGNDLLLDLISDCESKNPKNRPQDFEEVLQRLEEAEGGKAFGFPEKTGISVEEAFQAIDPSERKFLKQEALFTIIEEHDERVSAGKIMRIMKIGSVRRGQALEKAEVVVSKGPIPEVKYPSRKGITLEEAKEEIRGQVAGEYMLEHAFKVEGEEYSEECQAKTIARVKRQGIIQARTIVKPALLVLSKGPEPKMPKPALLVLSKGPEPKMPSFPGFSFAKEAAYACGKYRNTAQEFRHDRTGMEFVYIPGGTFQMAPNYKVTLSPYLIAKYPCTQAEWKEVMGNNPSNFKGDRRPVDQVSWADCQQFCQKAGLSLPSEAQWEYACRAGSPGKYCYGESESKLGEYAWYEANSNFQTHPVGEKKPNAFGLYDMHGNVWEWCQDWHGDYDEKETVDPKGAPSGSDRVFRGGSWSSLASFCRCSSRNDLSSVLGYYNLFGFRCALA